MTTLAGLKEWCKKHLDDEMRHLPDSERDALRGIYVWTLQYQGEQFDHVVIDAIFAPHVIGAAADLLEKDRYSAMLFGIWGWKISPTLHMQQCTPDDISEALRIRQHQLQELMYNDNQEADVLLRDIHREGECALELAQREGRSADTMKAIQAAIDHAQLVKQEQSQEIQQSVAILHAARHRYAASLNDLENIRQELLTEGDDVNDVRQLVDTATLAMTVVCQTKIEEQLAKISRASKMLDQALRALASAGR